MMTVISRMVSGLATLAALSISASASDAIRQYSSSGKHDSFSYGVFNTRWLGAEAKDAGPKLVAITGLSPDARGDVVIPSSLDGYTVYGIDGNAFRDCKGVESITIPKTVRFLRPGTLNRCQGLQRVVVDEDHPDYSTVDGVLFNKERTALLFYGSGRAGHCAIPGTTTAIGPFAFSFCTGLKSITIPPSVTDVGGSHGSVFLGCSSLESIEFPDTVTNVGQKSFQDCSSLMAAKLPAGITQIPFGLFWRCPDLVHVAIPDGVTSIGNYAFAGSKKMKLPSLPEKLTKIGAYAFKDCESLGDLARPEGLTTIDRGAFQGSPVDFSDEPDAAGDN